MSRNDRDQHDWRRRRAGCSSREPRVRPRPRASRLEKIPALTTRVSDLPPVFEPAEEINQIVRERAAQVLEQG
ncbi:hypothetical protein [Streptomyces sp. NPDC056921]|uniref:hypothetical protein n=1 Tax=Streptomyces sp. NPDC056921 TaxID=3345966 RepID=UPI00363A73A2